MADYKEIAGIKVQSIAGNPSVAVAGQLWYNATAATVKGNVFYNGVWSTSSATMNLGRKMVGSAGSSSNDGVIAGGITLMPSGQQTNQNATESFNGTAWTTGNNINSTRRGLGSAGISGTAALIMGGYLDPYTTASEKWDGTNWTSTPSLSSARDSIGGAGTSTSALAISGNQGVSITGGVESWNGSSWTTGTSSPNIEHLWQQACGKSNSDVLSWGGASYAPPTGYTYYNTCYLWDGSSWTAKNNTLQASRARSGKSCTSTTAIVNFGGSPDNTHTEIWDGTSWTAGNALPIAQGNAGSNGSGPSSTAAWIGGGDAPAITSPGDEGYDGTQIYNYGADTVTLASA